MEGGGYKGEGGSDLALCPTPYTLYLMPSPLPRFPRFLHNPGLGPWAVLSAISA